MKIVIPKRIFFLACLLFFSALGFSQIGIGTSTPASSALLDLSSTSSGFLPSRMSNASKLAIVAPVAGLTIWCVDCGNYGEMQVYNGTSWRNISGAVPSSPNLNAPAYTIQNAFNSKISFGTNSPASSAILDLTSTSLGFLPPRLTYLQKTAIVSPATALVIWCSNCGPFGEVQVFNGTSWTNISGSSASPTIPGSPTNLIATAGYTNASVSFTAPVSNGGGTITGYTVTSSPGSFFKSGVSSPLTVTGLSAGTAYTFTAIATNVTGNSVTSIASNSVTPYTVPDAPSIGTATAGNGQASVSFTAPVSNGGRVITGYTITSTPGNIAVSGTTSPFVVTGLTNGTSYTFKVVATNVAGNSTASSNSNSVTPIGAPVSPTNVIASAGITNASISFTAPVSNGGSAIIDYTVTSNPGGFAATGSNSPITVTGLTNGISYMFSVVARNSIGNSVASSNSNAVIPAAVSGSAICDGISSTTVVEITSSTGKIWMDRNLGASRAATSNTDYMAYGCLFQWGRGNDGHASINWTSASAGSAVNGSTTTRSSTEIPGNTLFISYNGDWITTQNNNLWQINSQTNNPCPSGFRVPSNIELGNEFTAYTITNNATAFSNGPSGGFKFVAAGYRNITSGAPLAITGSNGLYWTATLNGSPAVMAYLSSNSANVTNTYTNNRAFGQSVRCMKIMGAYAPTGVTATVGNAQAIVSFTVSTYDGGGAITNYTVTSNPGGFTASGATSPLTVTGLTNGTAYTFTIVATNSLSNSSASSPSNSVTPIVPTIPDAPTIGTASSAISQNATVTFTPPVFYGGSAIIDYTVTSNPGGFTATGAASPITITGLTNGTSYTFSVVARNIVGNSVASSNSNALTPLPITGLAICDGTVPTTVVEITSVTGKIWMDRNLGASRAAIASNDYMAYGCLYQWGRGNDGHASMNYTAAATGALVNGTTTTRSDAPGNNLFITNATTPSDWRSTSNNSLWQGVTVGNNNPCPAGFRIPTYTESLNEANIYTINTIAKAYTNGPSGGFKFTITATISPSGSISYGSPFWWTSTVNASPNNTKSAAAYFFDGGFSFYNQGRCMGIPVRCIKN